MDQIPAHLRLYDERYFAGHKVVSGYDDYATCQGVLNNWSGMVERLAEPRSVLDVGAAYGFVVQYFTDRNIPAYGVEPSDFARTHVVPHIANRVVSGALPDLPDIITDVDRRAGSRVSRFDVVTCTEVLEHIPEHLVGSSLTALTTRTERLLICLIMLEGPGADGDKGHICLKSRDWWEWQFTQACDGFVRREDLEATLDTDPYSQRMYWSRRFFVRERMA